ncbi:MAG: hypothetical protein ACP5E4_01395 [Candidatus Aenigmatarchaeota archaeon]
MRGVLFSGILVIIVVVFFSILMSQREMVVQEREQSALREEIRDMAASYASIERSLHTIADVSTKRSLIAVTSHLANNESFLGPMKAGDYIIPLLYNGTNDSDYGEYGSMMDENTLLENIALLEDYYALTPRNYDLDISIPLDNITLAPYDAFTLVFSAAAEVNLSKVGIAFLSKNLTITEKVSIIGFEDMLYLINLSRGKETRGIRRSPYLGNFSESALSGITGGSGYCYGELTDDFDAASPNTKIFVNASAGNATSKFCGVIFQSGDSPDTAYLRADSVAGLGSRLGESLYLLGDDEKLLNIQNFITHVEGKYYAPSTDGPSFFDRLEGNTSCTYCAGFGEVGLEKFADKNLLIALELPVGQEYSNRVFEYIQGVSGEEIGLNETSIGPAFYSFRLTDAAVSKYFS